MGHVPGTFNDVAVFFDITCLTKGQRVWLAIAAFHVLSGLGVYSTAQLGGLAEQKDRIDYAHGPFSIH